MATRIQTGDFTTGQIARLCKVAPKTVINWIDRGLLPAYKVPSGQRHQHRRVIRANLLDFIVKNGLPVPEELQVNAGGV